MLLFCPVIRGIPPPYGSLTGESARKIGADLMWTAFAATCATSSMFLTALAPSPLALGVVKKIAGLGITWGRWFAGFLPVGGPLLLVGLATLGMPA